MRQEHLCPECLEHFSVLQESLCGIGINFQIEPLLVRGLDYYTRTVFEITHPDLGAQDALGAGGRYDNLIKDLGGPQLGATGFALGVERLLLVAKAENNPATDNKLTFIIALGGEAQKQSLILLQRLRRSGICADTDYENKSLKGAMRRAFDLRAAYVVIIGDNELQRKVVTLKAMASGEQKEIRPDELIAELK